MLPILADFRQECEPLGEERIVQCLGNIAAIAKELAEESQHESWDWLPVIDVPWRQPKGEEFACIVDKLTVSLGVTYAVACTYGCDDGRTAPTRCATCD